MNDLSRLLYVSKSVNIINHFDLSQILESSRQNNAEAGITGVLCGSKSHFVQLLEGPENNLIQLYSKIIDDRRHRDCVLIGIVPISSRMFNKWSMGYIERNAEEITIEKEELLNYRLNRTDDGELIKIMQRFLNLLKK